MNKTNIIWPNGPFSLPDMEQYEKQIKKQKLVRNEFQLVGKYGIPLIKKQKIEITWNIYSHLYPAEEERTLSILNKV